MKLFSWITRETNIDFTGSRKFFHLLSIIMVVVSIGFMVVKGFNFGIDFSGGILLEIKSETPIDLSALRNKMANVDVADINLQTLGEDGTEVLIRAQAEALNEVEQRAAVEKIKEVIGDSVEYRKVELVGPQVGSELKKDGIISAILAVLAISIYVWCRFEWQFAVGALVGLAQDAIVAAGLLSMFDMDFSLITLASLLSLIGYSINDKVVTYDRIRENLKYYPKMPQLELINKSVNDVLARTLLTGLSTVAASGALLLLGGDVLRSFAFVITFGVIVGAYSSIFTSSMLLNLFDLRKVNEEENPFGRVAG